MSKTTMPKLSKKAIKLELESLIHKIDDELVPSSEDSIEQVIEYLRGCIIYQQFDLESTRRERQYFMDRLRKQ